MSQDNVRTVQDTHEAGAHGKHSRAHYAALVDKYFQYAHSNRLEEVVAMFTDDAFATFVVAPVALLRQGGHPRLLRPALPGLPPHRARDHRGRDRGQPRGHRAADDHRQPRRHPRGHALQHESLSNSWAILSKTLARDGQPRLIYHQPVGKENEWIRSFGRAPPPPDRDRRCSGDSRLRVTIDACSSPARRFFMGTAARHPSRPVELTHRHRPGPHRSPGRFVCSGAPAAASQPLAHREERPCPPAAPHRRPCHQRLGRRRTPRPHPADRALVDDPAAVGTLRSQIDALDTAIARLITERAQLSRRMQTARINAGGPGSNSAGNARSTPLPEQLGRDGARAGRGDAAGLPRLTPVRRSPSDPLPVRRCGGRPPTGSAGAARTAAACAARWRRGFPPS